MDTRPRSQGYEGYTLAKKSQTDQDEENRQNTLNSASGSMDSEGSGWAERRTNRSTKSKLSQRMPLTEERKRKAKIGAAKVFYVMEMEETLNVETSSVYGSAIVMPQLARSAGWPAQMNILAARSILFLVLNIILQWSLVYSLLKEQMVMDKFAGQMYLCDFGAVKIGCPDAPGCIGPDGTKMTPSRMYDFKQWRIQKFVKESLQTIFPDRRDDIEEKIDPGEYGVESAYCRHVCAFLFIMAVANDFFQCVAMVRLLWVIPNADDSWMSLFDEQEFDSIDQEVHIQIRGMPLHWKIINMFLIVLPKFVLWLSTSESGTTFLLETSTIQDTIVNATALAFILSLDELIFSTMSADATKFLMRKLEGYPIHIDPIQIDEDSAEAALENTMASFLSERDDTVLKKSDINLWCTRRSLMLKAPCVVVLWLFYECRYFMLMCEKSQEGAWVSVPVYTPESSEYSIWQALFPLVHVGSRGEPFWSMPVSGA